MTFFSRNPSNAEDMFQSIYETYKKRVFDYIGGKVSERDDIFDIEQNVFFHLWLYKDSLSAANLENIIFKTCNQEISKFFVQRSKQPSRADQSMFDVAEEPSDNSNELEKEEQWNELKLSIDLLPSTRRQILTLNKIDGMTQEKIAYHLNISKKAVKKQIEKAILFLRNQHKNS